MAKKTVVNRAVGGERNLIRSRREALGLTIEQAAEKAGVGSRTWSRYEAGAPIAEDKVSGVCKALGWEWLMSATDDVQPKSSYDHRKNRDGWSSDVAERFGDNCAASLAIGFQNLLWRVKADIKLLKSQPKGTHIGQLRASMTADILPEQFLMNYDYEFILGLKADVVRVMNYAEGTRSFHAYSAIDAIIVYMACKLGYESFKEGTYQLQPMTAVDGTPMSEDEQLYHLGTLSSALIGSDDVETELYQEDSFIRDTSSPFFFSNWQNVSFFQEELRQEGRDYEARLDAIVNTPLLL